MYRRAAKTLFTNVFKGKNPVETADKVKQVADAIAEGAKGMSRQTPVTQGKTRTFSIPTVSTSLQIETPTIILNENPYKTPVKRSSQVPLLPKLDRHSSRRVTAPLLYAPTLNETTSIITGNLFADVDK